MDKSILIAGVFGILAIIGMVLFVNSTINGNVVSTADDYAADYYVARPDSRMEFRVESGVSLLQSESVINAVCKNAVYCDGKAAYVCCNAEGTDCQVPSADDQARGSCPKVRRGRCQCREDYLAGLEEKYSAPAPERPVREYPYFAVGRSR